MPPSAAFATKSGSVCLRSLAEYYSSSIQHVARPAEKLSISMPHKLASAARKRAGRRGLLIRRASCRSRVGT
jgi:hypothetical protein